MVTVRERAVLVEPDNVDISISHQCELLEVSRTSYYQLEAVSPADQKDFEDLQLVLKGKRQINPTYKWFRK